MFPPFPHPVNNFTLTTLNREPRGSLQAGTYVGILGFQALSLEYLGWTCPVSVAFSFGIWHCHYSTYVVIPRGCQ